MITGLLALIAPEKRLVIMEQHFIDPVDVVVVIDDKIFHDDIKFPAVRKRISFGWCPSYTGPAAWITYFAGRRKAGVIAASPV